MSSGARRWSSKRRSRRAHQPYSILGEILDKARFLLWGFFGDGPEGVSNFRPYIRPYIRRRVGVVPRIATKCLRVCLRMCLRMCLRVVSVMVPRIVLPVTFPGRGTGRLAECGGLGGGRRG